MAHSLQSKIDKFRVSCSSESIEPLIGILNALSGLDSTGNRDSKLWKISDRLKASQTYISALDNSLLDNSKSVLDAIMNLVEDHNTLLGKRKSTSYRDSVSAQISGFRNSYDSILTQYARGPQSTAKEIVAPLIIDERTQQPAVLEKIVAGTAKTHRSDPYEFFHSKHKEAAAAHQHWYAPALVALHEQKETVKSVYSAAKNKFGSIFGCVKPKHAEDGPLPRHHKLMYAISGILISASIGAIGALGYATLSDSTGKHKEPAPIASAYRPSPTLREKVQAPDVAVEAKPVLKPAILFPAIAYNKDSGRSYNLRAFDDNILPEGNYVVSQPAVPGLNFGSNSVRLEIPALRLSAGKLDNVELLPGDSLKIWHKLGPAGKKAQASVFYNISANSA